MPGKNERDPLDDWLQREIQPLPPPPGTFTMITKRARRRKLRKLALTMTSAAAVAAAVVFTVPTVLSLHIGQSTASGNSVSNGKTPTQLTPSSSGPGSQQASTAQPSTSSSVSRPVTATPTTYPAGAAVPANFRPSSVTFISTRTGWVLGQGGPPCATHFCTSMALTQNGGQTWRGVPAPKTDGVSGVRFLDGKNGWAYGPELWATHDYGNTWSEISTAGQQVIDLETAGNQAFALFATCTTSSGGATSPSSTGNTATAGVSVPDCTSYTLETTQADGDHWASVGPATTNLADLPGARPAIVLSGSRGWLLAADGALYSGPLTSAWQKTGIAQCPATAPGSADTLDGGLLTWDTYTSTLVLACSAKSLASSGSQKELAYTSRDNGATWQGPTAGVSQGTAMSLATAPTAVAILATTGGIEVLDASTGQWNQAVSVKGGFSYIGMTSDQQGVAVPADPSLHEIWMTVNRGLNWTPYQFSA
jgi:hypothetical protein